jgi:hypothetical protein
MSSILYVAAFLCLGIFMFVGKGILEIEVFTSEMDYLYNYIGYMSIGLGIFSSSVLIYLGNKFEVK